MGMSEQVGTPCREKFWHERDAEQKLEMLREAIVQQDDEIRRLRVTVDKLADHKHGNVVGEILLPMRGDGNNGGICDTNWRIRKLTAKE